MPVPAASLVGDGVNDRLYAAHDAALNITGDLTVEWWAKWDQTTDQQSFLGFQGDGGGNIPYSLRTSYSRLEYDHINAWDSTTFVENIGFVPVSTWHHYAFVREGSNGQFFIDGIPIINKIPLSGVGTSPGSNTTGLSLLTSIFRGFATMKFAELRIWNVARTTQQIRDNFNVVAVGTETNLVRVLRPTTSSGSTVTAVGPSSASTVFTVDGATFDTVDIPAIESATIPLLGSGYLSVPSGGNRGIYARDFGHTALHALQDGDWTFEGWVCDNFGSYGHGNQYYFHKGTGIDGGINVYQGFGIVSFTLRVGSTDYTISEDISGYISAGTWHHIAATFDRTAKVMRLYINGSLKQTSSALPSAPATHNFAAGIGSGEFAAENWGSTGDGGYSIKEFRIWNDRRTDTEIADNYNKIVPSNSPNLLLRWKFNEGSGLFARDTAVLETAHHGVVFTGTWGTSSDVSLTDLDVSGVTITPTGLTNTNSFGSPTVFNTLQVIAPTGYTNTNAFGSPTVVRQEINPVWQEKVSPGNVAAAATNTITRNKPTVLNNGDLLIAYIITGANATSNPTTVPTGWTLVGSRMNSGTTFSAWIYRKYIDGTTYTAGSEPASYTWSGFPVSGRMQAAIHRISNVDPTTQVEVVGTPSSNAAGTTWTAPGLTPLSINDMIISVWFGAPTAFTASPTLPGAMTSRSNDGNTGSGVDVQMVVATEILTTATATGTRAISGMGSSASIGQTLAIKPISGPAAQTIVITGHSNTSTFGSPTIAPQAVSIVPVGLTNVSTFGSPAVKQAVTPVGLTNVSTFGSPTIAPQAVTISVAAYTNVSTFGSPTIAPQAVGISPTALTNVSTFGSPTITPSVTIGIVGLTNVSTIGQPTIAPQAVVIAPVSVVNASTFGSPTVTAQAVTIAPASFQNAQTFGQPTVTPQAVGIAPTSLVNASTFGAPTVTPQAVGITATGLTNVNNFGLPSVAINALTIVAVGFANAQSFGLPAVAPQAVSIAPTGLTNANAVGQPDIVALQPGAVYINPSSVVNAQSFGAPTLVPQAVTIAPSSVTNVQSFGSPAILSVATVGPVSAVNVNTFGQPVITAGPVTIGVSGFVNISVFGQPVISSSAVTITPISVVSSNSFGQPAVTVGAASIVVQALVNNNVFGSPIIGAGALTINVAALTNTNTIGLPYVYEGAIREIDYPVSLIVPSTGITTAHLLSGGITIAHTQSEGITIAEVL